MTRTAHSRWSFVIGAVLLAAAAGTRAQAQDEAQPAARTKDEVQKAQEELDRTPEDCVLMNRVARNVAASNAQVVFFMRGNTYYLNVLDGACQALTKGETQLEFIYQTRSARVTRLCDTDSFTVYQQTSRIGCALGPFIPITAEEASALTGLPITTPAASNSGNAESSGGSSRRGSGNQ